MNKPHKGKLKNWTRFAVGDGTDGLGYVIFADFVEHPQFADRRGHTSLVVKREGNEIETRNSRYTLVGDESK